MGIAQGPRRTVPEATAPAKKTVRVKWIYNRANPELRGRIVDMDADEARHLASENRVKIMTGSAEAPAAPAGE